MSTWKVSVYGDCLPLSHLSHHRRLDSPAPKYNQSWCPDEHVGSIVYGDYPPPDALLALSQHCWQPVPAPPPPPPQNIYHPTNHDVLQDWQRAQARRTIMLCVWCRPSFVRRSSLKCHPYYSCFIEMQLHVQRLKEMQRLQTPLEIIARSGNCHPVLGRSSKDRDFFVHSRNFI